MMVRFLAAALAAVAVIVGGAALQDAVQPRAAASGGRAPAFSGAWLCPHGGGPGGWSAWLELTNPGSDSVPVRVTTFGKGEPKAPWELKVPAQTAIRIKVPADERARSSMVEYFGGWVSAAWVTEAGGDESGIAAEPCVTSTSRSWLLPDGTTVRGEDDWIVVMNPTSTDAVFSLQVDTDQGVVLTKEWSDIVLPGRRSTAFLVNTKALGRRTAVGEVEASIGRVAAATLGISRDGGIRSAVGVPGPSTRVILPGAEDIGHTEISAVDPGPDRASYGGSLNGLDKTQVLGQLKDQVLGPHEARTFGVATTDPSTIDLRAQQGLLASTRRTFGGGGDQASTAGFPASRSAWVIPSGASSRHDAWRLVLANPGSTPAKVTLRLLTPSGPSKLRAERTFVVRPLRTFAVPPAYTRPHPLASAVALATSGTFVAVSVSDNFDGSHFAVTSGLAIPGAWIPR
jgi:hypothetical protein